MIDLDGKISATSDKHVVKEVTEAEADKIFDTFPEYPKQNLGKYYKVRTSKKYYIYVKMISASVETHLLK